MIVISRSSFINIQVCSIENQKEKFTLQGHKEKIYNIAVTSTGNYVVSATQNEIIVWDILLKKQLWNKKINFSILSIALTHDDQLIVIGHSDMTIKIWSLSEFTELASLTGHKSSVYKVAVSHSDKFIISVSIDKTIRIWNIQNIQQERMIEGFNKRIENMIITCDDRFAVFKEVCPLAICVYNLIENENIIELNRDDIKNWSDRYKEIRDFINK